MIARTRFLGGSAATLAALALPRNARAAAHDGGEGGDAWRPYVVTTTVRLPAKRTAKLWLPIAGISSQTWIQPLTNEWRTNAPVSQIRTDAATGTPMLAAEWTPKDPQPVLQGTCVVELLDRTVSFGTASAAPRLDDAARAAYTAGTPAVPTDGIVRRTAERIVGNATTPLARARALYEWVAANTTWAPSVRGCGTGDVRAMLQSGNPSGKSADLNGLFVALARAAGLPARTLAGLRVAPSRYGFASLGVDAMTVTDAQDCRAEVWIDGTGWVPADPAGVRAAAAEEARDGRRANAAKLETVRSALFGTSETNWIAFNDGRDVRLPGSAGPAVPFLMYPQAEVDGARLDCLAPEEFSYTIEARRWIEPGLPA